MASLFDNDDEELPKDPEDLVDDEDDEVSSGHNSEGPLSDEEVDQLVESEPAPSAHRFSLVMYGSDDSDDEL
ncbi:hypothetical protein M413DRAFT_32872 [Hebeloma cylindrosporum]|uniref:Uncharacterized protein n=1 Tax=Hebeloma cylindrosporum TaxID=76867 RepID=A0A0C3BSC4_HEBCY|nr:hypothetical protein M413DRAFT_32872 [Hebeloma cylindrosporum h7]